MFYISTRIKKCDLFGQHITLNLQNRQNFKTLFGGVISLIICAILASMLFYKANRFFRKEEVKVTQIQTISPDPLQMKLEKQKFMFAISIQQFGTAYIENPFFQIEVEKREYIRDKQGNLDKKKVAVKMEPCTLEHWIHIESSDKRYAEDYWRSQFRQLSLQNWLCPDINEVFSLQGFYSSKVFEFIKFKVIDCVEGNPSFEKWKNYTCANQQQMENHLQEQENYRFQLYASNYQINGQSTSGEVFVPYLLSDLHFGFKPGVKFTTVDIYLENYRIETDENLFFTPNIQNQSFPVIKFSEMREETSFNVSEQKFGIAAFYLRRSSASSIISRKFTTFTDLVSYFGGFMQALLSVFGVVALYFNRQQQLITMANNLYQFENDQNNSGPQKIKEKQDSKYYKGIQQLQTKFDNKNGILSQNNRKNGSVMTKKEEKPVDQNSIIASQQKIGSQRQITQEEKYNFNEQTNQLKKMLVQKYYNHRNSKIQQSEILGLRQSILQNNLENNNNNNQQSPYKRFSAQTQFSRTQTLQFCKSPTKILGNNNGQNQPQSSLLPVQDRQIQPDKQVIEIEMNPLAGKQLKQQQQQHQATAVLDLKRDHENICQSNKMTSQKSSLSQKALQENFNKLYSLKDSNKCGALQQQQQLQSHSREMKNYSKQQEEMYKVWSKKQYLTNQFEQLLQRSSEIKLNIQYLIFRLSYRKLCKNRQTLLIFKSSRLVKKQMDVIQILGKLHEIDKLKTILLKKEQLFLFNCSPKPMIISKENEADKDDQYSSVLQQHMTTRIDIVNKLQRNLKNGKKRRNFHNKLNLPFTTYMLVIKAKGKFINLIKHKQQVNLNNFRQFEQLALAYEKLQDTQSEDPLQQHINEQLIQQMGQEMKEILISSLMIHRRLTTNMEAVTEQDEQEGKARSQQEMIKNHLNQIYRPPLQFSDSRDLSSSSSSVSSVQNSFQQQKDKEDNNEGQLSSNRIALKNKEENNNIEPPPSFQEIVSMNPMQIHSFQGKSGLQEHYCNQKMSLLHENQMTSCDKQQSGSLNTFLKFPSTSNDTIQDVNNYNNPNSKSYFRSTSTTEKDKNSKQLKQSKNSHFVATTATDQIVEIQKQGKEEQKKSRKTKSDILGQAIKEIYQKSQSFIAFQKQHNQYKQQQQYDQFIDEDKNTKINYQSNNNKIYENQNNDNAIINQQNNNNNQNNDQNLQFLTQEEMDRILTTSMSFSKGLYEGKL